MDLLKYLNSKNRIYGIDTPIINDKKEHCIYYKFTYKGKRYCLLFNDILSNGELYSLLNKTGKMDLIRGTR